MAINKRKSRQSNRFQSIMQLLILLAILVVVNILANIEYGHIDLTEDKRFTLTEATKNLITDVDDAVTITIYLDGELPGGFRRLRQSVFDLVREFRSRNPNIHYRFENPVEGSTQSINETIERLGEQGIQPVNLQMVDADRRSEKIIFPAAMIFYKGRRFPLNLLENQVPGMPQEIVLNNSINLLEFKFAQAILKLRTAYKPNVVLVDGHGELNEMETADFQRSVRQFYNLNRLNLDSVTEIRPIIDMVIVARPRAAFTEQQKFILDQYLMNGGKIIFMISPLDVALDSLRGKDIYVPRPYNLNLDDMLFRYGARINSNVVMDLESSRIPQVVGMVGGSPQIELLNWPYHPLVIPRSDHPIVKNLDRVDLRFPASIDTIRTRTPIEKTILLESSPYSRLQFAPLTLSFEVLRVPQDPARYNKPHEAMAVLLEGQFPSLFENRVPQEMQNMLTEIGQQYLEISEPTSIMVISDGSFAQSAFIAAEQRLLPMGYNEYMNYQFANKDLLINAMDYMLDEWGVMEARRKEIRLRLLDRNLARNQRTQWQLINFGAPLAFLALFGILYNFIRRKRFVA
jgi:ABC-2 type transport system permease protein